MHAVCSRPVTNGCGMGEPLWMTIRPISPCLANEKMIAWSPPAKGGGPLAGLSSVTSASPTIVTLMLDGSLLERDFYHFDLNSDVSTR